MEPLQPDPSKAPSESARPDNQPLPEARTLALRPGGLKRPVREEPPAVPPADAALPLPPPSDSPPDVTHGATVSINQVKQMRSLLEAPPPQASGDPPGTTTVPLRRVADSRPVPEEARPAAPLRPRPSAPGTIKPPSESGPAVPVDPKLLCPHCQAKLISPENLGMCPSCGYCRSLEEGKDKVPPSAKSQKPSLLGLVEFCQLLGMIPRWWWILVSGMAAVILGAIYGPRYLTANATQRAWWGTTQFVLGMLLMATAQIRAIFRVALLDERVGPWDMFLWSARVWRLVLDRLPQTRDLLWMACWGWTLALSTLLVSGLPFTGLGAPEENVLLRDLRAALRTLPSSEFQSLQTAARADVKAAAEAPPPPEREGDDPRPTQPCAVIGYTRDAQDKPTGLIVATLEKGQLRYAGIVRTGLQKSKELLQQLGAMKKVDGPSDGGAVWIKPDLTVDIHHSGTSGTGTLQEPNLGGLSSSPQGE